jgi:WD40 repeat protein
MPAAAMYADNGEEKTHAILETIELSDESDDEFRYEELPEDPDLEQEEDELDDINRLIAETRPIEDTSGWAGVTSLTTNAHPGDKEIQVASQQWAQVGNKIMIGSEQNVVAGFGAILLQNPLQTARAAGTSIRKQDVSHRGGESETSLAQVQHRPQVIDDFFRNFLTKYGMKRSLESFQSEWYELQQSGKFHDVESNIVPDIYLRNQSLGDELSLLRQELDNARMIASKAKQNWDTFRKERDFHRMHHRRVVQEKNRLIIDLKRLKRHYEQYEPTLTELRHKYEVAMKEKMLMRLERDRFLAKAESLQKQLNQVQQDEAAAGTMAAEIDGAGSRSPKKHDSPMPAKERSNPHATANYEAARASEFKKQAQVNAHLGCISNIAFHPKIPVIATASDDHTWKMWSMPNGEHVLTGEGHKDWVSSVKFHPKGSLVATTSGDFTCKIWDVSKEKCKYTLQDHKQAVWDCSFHDLGDFLATGSMDQTCKLFDMQTMKCRQTFRGHVDSVNSVNFQPYGQSHLLTASGDKTVSLWDLRTGLCAQTFYGHKNACNHAVFALKGDMIASCDADGIVKLWDVRFVSELLQIDTGQHPANSAAFDRSGKILTVASGDGTAKVFNTVDRCWVNDLVGHTDSVQAVAFEPVGYKYLVTASSDASFILWQ